MRAVLVIVIMFAALALTPLAGAEEEPLQADDPSPQGLLSPAETPAAAPKSLEAPTLEGPQAGPSTFDLPPLEAMEWRALDAEIRAIQAEAMAAIKERELQRNKLKDTWKTRYGIKGLDGWEIDFGANKLRKQKQEVPIVR